MAADQSDPPEVPKHLPPVLRRFLLAICDYLTMIRPVAGDNVTIEDADGGGSQINASQPPAASQIVVGVVYNSADNTLKSRKLLVSIQNDIGDFNGIS